MTGERKRRRWILSVGTTCLALLGIKASLSAQAPNSGDTGSDSGVQVVERGPVHEAYLQRYSQPVTAPSVDREPPEPVMERESDIQPDDPQAIWIPGYWAWDETRNDFLWISGLWRVPPPGMHWIKGFWDKDEQGWRWIGGFWSAVVEDVAYIPEPPPQDQVDEGPVGPPPNENCFWVPGNYEYTNQTYVWKAGYWAPNQPKWIWTPAHYDWTPSGYLFTAGYWDYPLDARGILFAPVYFPRPLLTSSFYYTPSYTIGASLLDWIFVRSGYRSYYYGNYFGPSFAGQGFYSWYDGGFPYGGLGHGFYDPSFYWYRERYRHDFPRPWLGRREHRTEPRPLERPRQKIEIVHNRNVPAVRSAPPEVRRNFLRQQLADRARPRRLSERVVDTGRSGRTLPDRNGRLLGSRQGPAPDARRSYLEPTQRDREVERGGLERRDLRERDLRRMSERNPAASNGGGFPERGRTSGREVQPGANLPRRGNEAASERPRLERDRPYLAPENRTPRRDAAPRSELPERRINPEMRQPNRFAEPRFEAQPRPSGEVLPQRNFNPAGGGGAPGSRGVAPSGQPAGPRVGEPGPRPSGGERRRD